jgi:16S rRNA (adenine1518-N6/adenine1519-N6)-dimethyltransferase
LSTEYRLNGAKAVRELLEKHGIRLSKAMGQNFLIDPNIPEKIVNLSGIDSSCGVLEVGPGIGVLTERLCRAAGHVTAVEVDRRLPDVLRDTLGGAENVEIIRGDILKLDIGALVYEKMQGYHPCVCANLPYNITTPVLTALIEARLFESVTVMTQREFARRICASPGSGDYGALTLFVNYHTAPKMLFDVPPECFMPRPKVHSTVVTMKMRAEGLLPPEQEALFFRVVRAAFGQRRKTLVNALYAVFGSQTDKDEIAEIVQSCGFGPNVRGETLGIGEFAKISENFSKKLNKV